MSDAVMIHLLFCRQSPCCDLTRCYRLLYFVYFTLRKRISGEYTFDLIHAFSKRIRLVLGKYHHLLIYFYFYIQTHFIEQP